MKEYKIYDIAVIGVRKDESAKRAKRYDEPIICRFYGSKKVHAQNVMPILDWTLQDVADYIEDRKIKCAPVYYEGDVFHPERRLGCMGCPIASKAHRLKELRDHPAMVKAILRSLQKYYDTHQHTKTVEHYGDIYTQFTRFYFFDTDEQFYKRQSNIFGDVDCKKFLEDYFGITL